MGRPKVAERLVGVGGQDEALLLGLQALADPIRLQMVRLLAEQEQCVCHLTETLGLSQASISHHMAVLKRAGLVQDRRDARWTYYRLAPEATFSLRRSVDEFLDLTPAVPIAAVCCDTLEDQAPSQALTKESEAQGAPISIERIDCSDTTT
jgi:ArsR family transcriptional regulator, arsenate/arsenite/antimonite-responsive transcriptional repressor